MEAQIVVDIPGIDGDFEIHKIHAQHIADTVHCEGF